jgi:hypothetical protein
MYDVLGCVDVDTMHQHFAMFVPALVRFSMFPAGVHPASYQQFAALYYERLARNMSDTQAANSEALSHDRFWAKLLQAIALPRAPTFDADTVRALGRRIAAQPRNAAR